MPFVAVNCSAIPEELIESELFGHERGAFTGATQARRGRFEEAHGGTLFLDEVGDLSRARRRPSCCACCRRASCRASAATAPIAVDVRVVAATNRDLRERVASAAFREDLYFRLAVIPITVPPLRERAEDVPLLVEHFARADRAGDEREAARRSRLLRSRCSSATRFPGNVRELRNLVERLIIMTPGREHRRRAGARRAAPQPTEADGRVDGALSRRGARIRAPADRARIARRAPVI